ncbi:MAG TPA: MlaD family protein, partial [Rhizomicrobium sp.]|nr:MlaD family protein [Rhizomicrobium sp.]
METKANYVAVGAFVLACVIGLVVTVLWLAGIQYSQEYAYYQAYFKGPVTGLGKGTSTRYNGIEVGRITNLEFDPTDPQRVIVTMQVQPNLKIREDSVASIESQGFTGATFVEITGGTAKSQLLEAQGDQRYPVIRTKPSTFAQLQQSAPEVVAKLNVAVSRLNDLLNDDNRRSIAHVLANLDETSQVIAKRSADIDATIANANKTMANLSAASSNLRPQLDDALSKVDLTVQKYGKVADDADAYING